MKLEAEIYGRVENGYNVVWVCYSEGKANEIAEICLMRSNMPKNHTRHTHNNANRSHCLGDA